MRICRTCQDSKPLSDFGKDKKGPEGLNRHCKSCNSKRSGKYYHATPVKERQDKHKQNYNSDKKRDSHYRNRYGISLVEVLEIAERQNYKCPICDKTCKFLAGNKDDAYVIDHCHSTLKVRGLICATCNRGLGLFYDNPAMLRKAADYLE